MEMEIKKFTVSYANKLRADALQTVLIKLETLSKTASFNDTRWIFDWDNSKAPIDNIDKCNAEFDSLMLLQNEKVINVKTEPNPDISISLNKVAKGYREQKDYKVSDNSSYLPEADEAGRHYHTAVWITGFDIDRFRSINNRVSPSKSNLTNGATRIIIKSGSVAVELPDSTYITLKRLRTDGAPYNFMEYVLTHPDKDIGRGTIQTTVEGCERYEDMTELVRNCGFNSALKKVFFAGTTSKVIHFKNNVSLSDEQIEEIKSAVKTKS